LRSFLGNGPEYDSDDIDYNAPLCMCYNINDKGLAEEAPMLMPSDWSPHSCTTYLLEKADRLQGRRVDLETAEAKLKRQR
jgi:hypothetical protein